MFTMNCFLLFALVVVTVSAGRLDNNYLPPTSPQFNGNNGYFSNKPDNAANNQNFRPLNPTQPSNNYLPPSSDSIEINKKSGNNYFNPIENPANIAILRQANENPGDGSYSYGFETENRIIQEESAEFKNDGPHQGSTIAKGSYTYISPEGITHTVNYIADENGFQAKGDHLPTPPPIPDVILRSLELNAAQEAAGIYDDGQYRPEHDGKSSNGNGSPSNQYLGPQSGYSQQGGYRY